MITGRVFQIGPIMGCLSLAGLLCFLGSGCASEPQTDPAALHRAVELNNVAEIKRLVASGASPSDLATYDTDRFEQIEGMTPLGIAAQKGNMAALDTLLLLGAPVNALDVDGRTPLHCAAMNEIFKAGETLLAHGATVNVRDFSGETPLWCAVRGDAGKDTDRLIDLLLAHGADATIPDKDGLTPLHVSAKHSAVASLIKHGAPINARTKKGYTPLHLAISRGETEAAKALLDANADIRSRDDMGWTPLHTAAAWRRTEIAQELLRRNAEVSSRDLLGNTPLHLAARYGSKDIVTSLLKSGASRDVVNNLGMTPWSNALGKGFSEIATMLSTGEKTLTKAMEISTEPPPERGRIGNCQMKDWQEQKAWLLFQNANGDPTGLQGPCDFMSQSYTPPGPFDEPRRLMLGASIIKDIHLGTRVIAGKIQNVFLVGTVNKCSNLSEFYLPGTAWTEVTDIRAVLLQVDPKGFHWQIGERCNSALNKYTSRQTQRYKMIHPKTSGRRQFETTFPIGSGDFAVEIEGNTVIIRDRSIDASWEVRVK